MVAVPLHSAVQLYLASLNIAELYSSAVECGGVGGSYFISDNGVHYHYIFMRNHLYFLCAEHRQKQSKSQQQGGVHNHRKGWCCSP